MNDQQTPQSAPQHPAPAQGYIPLSGLAVTSFVLSIVFMFVALYGLWIVELIPLGMGILTLMTVKAGQKRGRILALWAVVIAIGAGSCTYFMHTSARSAVREMGESILAALSAKGASPEDRAKALKPWLFEEALEKKPELIETFHQRFAEVEEAFGPYKGEVDLGSPYQGAMAFMMAPKDIEEFGTGEAPPGLLAVVWIGVVFEKGKATMAIVLKKGSQDDVLALGELQGSEVPIVGDIRFFRPTGGP